jgi:hypothetical protein
MIDGLQAWVRLAPSAFSRRVWYELREFPEILDCRCHAELVFRAVWTSETQAVEPEETFEVGEQHFRLPAGIAGCHLGIGFDDGTELL